MKKCYLLLLLLICSGKLLAQQNVSDANLVHLLRLHDSLKRRLPIEKLYLQTDKPNYTNGGTIRFKAYLLNGDFLNPSTKSRLLYVELDDQANQPVKRMMFNAESGLAWGDIALALDGKKIPEGIYILRAYTNWMRNFGEDYIFKKVIYITSVTTNTTLVNTDFKLLPKDGKNNIQATLQFTSLNGNRLSEQDLQLKVLDGKKNLSKDKVITDGDGSLKVNFDLPDKVILKDVSIQAQFLNKSDTQELTIPVILNRPENADLQFMPEGGNMVAGINNKIAFKAIGEDGKGIAVNGKIYDNNQKEITSFKSGYGGMGAFDLMPITGTSYTAKINLPGGITRAYSLPVVNKSGSVLNITSNTSDSLLISINITADLIGQQNTYYLIGQARGLICYAQSFIFDGKNIKKQIAKDLFPTGITRFTLLNASHQPLNERLVFIDHRDELHIDIQSNKPKYTVRDSVALSIQVKDKDGKPIQGNFSFAVTDNSQVKPDSIASNMLTNLLLTSDLKGTVETPGYYFIGDKIKKAIELDNLMLTQGWVGYEWRDVISPIVQQPVYTSEPQFIIKGQVTNAFGKPIKKSNVILIANNPLIFKGTQSDDGGHFSFMGLFPVDTAIFKLQARNKNGKEMNVRISMDEVKPPVFTYVSNTLPWYVNSDTILINNSNSKIAQLKAVANYNGEGNILKEVTIKDKKIVKGSKNLNGPGEADVVLDEKDLEKLDKMTLLDLLTQKVPGFGTGGFTPYKRRIKQGEANYVVEIIKGRVYKVIGPWRFSYMVFDKEMRLIIDGVDLDYYYDDSNENPTYDRTRNVFMKSYLEYFTAEDITGIEVMNSDKYNAGYNAEFLSITEQSRAVTNQTGPLKYAYIEVTTRSKQGPFMQVTPGTYLYKTLAFTVPKQFYRPRYTVSNSKIALGTDLRSTIHWEPNVITDKNGKAIVSFYTSDRPGNYTIIMEGSDMNGNIGSVMQKL